MDLASSFNTLSIEESSKVNRFAAIIGANHTEFLLTNFPNYLNVFITQFGKIGNLYQVKVDQPENALSIADPVFTVTTLLGGENIESEVAVRYLTEKLKINKPLLVSLSLKDYKKTTVDAIINAIKGYFNN